MEHGQREPKLSEALALSRLLHFDLSEIATPLDASRARTQVVATDLLGAVVALIQVGVSTHELGAAIEGLDDDSEHAATVLGELMGETAQDVFREVGIRDLLTPGRRHYLDTGLALVTALASEIEEGQ